MKNAVLTLSFEFAFSVINYCEELECQRKYVISRHLLKSGTSIGANVREAQNPHSRADFISKMVIAMREADETSYWLDLCKQSKTYADPGTLSDKIIELKKLIGSIIVKSKKNTIMI